MTRPLRIGTRDSKLALWQASHVARKLEDQGVKTELVPVKSEGDLDLETPLAEMGGKGVFTKALDEALLGKRIDLAVHSYKDLPTENSLPLSLFAVLEREDPRDVLVAPQGDEFLDQESPGVVVATGSNRRKGQWLHRYPEHRIINIRGNVQTRLRKVRDNGWNGAVFAAAGLKRVDLADRITRYLDWMVPAPAQGAIAVTGREDDLEIAGLAEPLTHPETALCTGVERELLARLEAGCSAPLGAHAYVESGRVKLKAVVLKLDGSLQYDVELDADVSEAQGLGTRAAESLLQQGADRLVDEIRGRT